MGTIASIQVSGFFALVLVGVGFFGLAVLVLGLIVRSVAAVVRMLCCTGGSSVEGPMPPPEACSHGRCGHVNPPGARFCARCGRALRGAFEGRVA